VAARSRARDSREFVASGSEQGHFQFHAVRSDEPAQCVV
jgi:hypothetical protein